MSNPPRHRRTNSKRTLPSVPSASAEKPLSAIKSVTFNEETVETSIGGTITTGKIKTEPLKSVIDIDNVGDSAFLASPKKLLPGLDSKLVGKENQTSSGSTDVSDEVSEGGDTSSDVPSLSLSDTPQPAAENPVNSANSTPRTSLPRPPFDRRDQLKSKRERSNSGLPVPTSTHSKQSETQVTQADKKVRKSEAAVSATSSSTSSISTAAAASTTVSRTPTANSGIPASSKMPGKSVVTDPRRHTLETHMYHTPDCYKPVRLDYAFNGRSSSSSDYGYDVDYSSSETNDDGEDSVKLTVAVRVRPFSQREATEGNARKVVSMCRNETMVTTDSGQTHHFAYDFSLWSFDKAQGDYADQEYVYVRLAQPLLTKAFEGYNTCLFAYGQTGSGKSYSMMGHGEDVGIIPRFCEELFARAASIAEKQGTRVSVEISFFEIYNEKIHDLLSSAKDKGGKKATLRVRENPNYGPFVEGLSTYVVNSFEDVEGWINVGNKNRATAATGMNDKSSRSHSVFTIVLTQTKTEMLEGQQHDHAINSKINLVDLAGSERQSLAQTSGERLREGANINKSLLTLGKVISMLSEQSVLRKRKTFIPYRDSILTWLLRESLGGNSKTAMIATISPCNLHIEETLSTLRYAQQARAIVNVVRVNEDPKARIIKSLRAEIDKLNSMMKEGTQDQGLAEIYHLRQQLSAKEKEMEEMTKSWQQRLRQSEARLAVESRTLEKSGITMKVDNQLPNLVNLNEDPQLSELLLYVIKAGQTSVGRMSTTSTHDIQLNGALIADNHCTINNEDGVVTITPIAPIKDAPTYINGILISQPSTLHHGDRVILGGDHYFRFNHPLEVAQGKSGWGVLEMQDFEFAKQELHGLQEEKLQVELRQYKERLQATEEKAASVMSMERSNYEDKLAGMARELEHKTQEASKASQSWQEAEDQVSRLKREKLMLEHEVKAGRKRQQLEAEAAERATTRIEENRSRLFELLEAERDRVAAKLEEIRSRRQEGSSLMHRTHLPPNASTKRTDLYRIALLVHEANKICQYMNKRVAFSREDELEGERVKTLIKVANTQHGVVTFWSLAKFEERLMQLRDLYQDEGDDNTMEDDILHDPEDSWERESSFLASPTSSPKEASVMKSPCVSNGASPAFRPTHFSNLSASKRSSLGTSGIREALCDTTVVRLCREMVTSSLDSFNALCREESTADKILCCCQSLRLAVTTVLDRKDGETVCTEDSQAVKRSAVAVLSGLQQLLLLTSLWSRSLAEVEAPSIQDLLTAMTATLRSVGSSAAMFLQGLENDVGSIVQESGAKVQDGLLSAVRLSGQLALATDTPVLQLDQPSSLQPSQLDSAVCQAFVGGCDDFVKVSLQGALNTLDDSEAAAQTFMSQEALRSSHGDLLRLEDLIVSSVRGLLLTCQEVQTGWKGGDGKERVAPQVYGRHYSRARALVSQTATLVDGTGLLLQATLPAVTGNTNGEMRRILRCAEMIQRAASDILALSEVGSQGEGVRSSVQDDPASLLSASHTARVAEAAQAVVSLTTRLEEQVQKASSPLQGGRQSGGKVKRLLPPSPDALLSSQSLQLQRQQSAVRRHVSLYQAASAAK